MLERNQNRTKILATLGPACGSPTAIRAMVRAGVDAFRINMSHGDRATRETWVGEIRRLRRTLRRPVAILVDLRGPRLRLGELPGTRVLRRGEEVLLGDAAAAGQILCVEPAGLLAALQPGQRVLLRDGRVELVVTDVRRGRVRARVRRGGEVGSHHGVNLPDSVLDLSLPSKQDREDIAWAVAAGVDWLAVSFVRSVADLEAVRAEVARHGGTLPVMAKIERPEAVRDLDQILEAADAVMVARGDLAVEMGLETVPLLQKRIILRAREHGVPVVTATQMLESMMAESQPTRAEVSDVANAVLDGSDAVMLSGETAVGRNPLAAVRAMRRIVARTERELARHRPRRVEPHPEALGRARVGPVERAAVRAALVAAAEVDARVLLAFTESGRTARLLSAHRPQQPIIGLTPAEATFHRMALYRGVRPAWIGRVRSLPEMYRKAAGTLATVPWLRPTHLVVALTGTFAVSGATNTVRLLPLGDLPRAAGKQHQEQP